MTNSKAVERKIDVVRKDTKLVGSEKKKVRMGEKSVVG
jgi:hypothetical protein